MPARNRRVVVATAAGALTPRMLAIEECPEPQAGGNHLLLDARYLSIDPYMLRALGGQGRRHYAPGEPMTGRMVARIAHSPDPDLSVGDWVLTESVWQDRLAVPVSAVEPIHGRDEHELVGHLGALGQSGLTAWLGMEHLGRPREGMTVLVSSAAGTVGSVAGQIARIRGARVVGIAGGDAKCRYVVGRFGFDDCLDYRATDFGSRLASLQGAIDLYFDNVGGAILDTVLATMADDGGVLICGQISQYARKDRYPLTNFDCVLERRLRVTGFGVSQLGALRPGVIGPGRMVCRWATQL